MITEKIDQILLLLADYKMMQAGAGWHWSEQLQSDFDINARKIDEIVKELNTDYGLTNYEIIRMMIERQEQLK